MYARQVVNDIPGMNHSLPKEAMVSLQRDIELSHKFHLGSVEDIPFSSVDGKGTLFFDYKEYIKLPYSACWLDFYSPMPDRTVRVGVLLYDTLDDIYMPIFIKWGFPAEKFNLYIVMFWDKKVSSLGYKWKADTEPDIIEDNITLRAIVTVIQQFILLLNCKNIELIKNHPDPNPKHIEKRIRKGIKPVYSYYTLKLKLPSYHYASKEQQEEAKNHNRLHFCRGHFKKYTADNPLFGKIIGLWWWQSQMRGQNKQGLIEKEYEIVRNRV